MKHVKEMIEAVTKRLDGIAKGKAVTANTISVGDRHVIPLCELSFGFGAGGGEGEACDSDTGAGSGKGVGGGAGAGVKATPVAVVVVEGGKVRLEKLGW